MDELKEQPLRDILSHYQGKTRELIPILLDVQAEFSYLPKEAIQLIANFLNVAEGAIYSVCTFYSQFRLKPLGRQLITVCRGTACHIHGAAQVLEKVKGELGLEEGETSSDLEYTLETIACIGCCALAPCLKINGKVYGEINLGKATELFTLLNKGGHDV